MSYLEDMRQKAIQHREFVPSVVSNPGGESFLDGCIFRNLKREFVLSNPALNICAGVREK